MAVAPNFVINEKPYVLPMVIEESSVVAASANSAKFWSKRGGFHTNYRYEENRSGALSVFRFSSRTSYIFYLSNQNLKETEAITKNMRKREI